ISETVLKDVALMTFDEINASGGVMGYKIEPIVVDPASNWPLFAEKARQLLTQDKVAAVFGCWTSLPQIGAAGLRRAERASFLSGAIRGRGDLAERLLYGRRAESAGDTRRRIPHEQGRRCRQALGAAW